MNVSPYNADTTWNDFADIADTPDVMKAPVMPECAALWHLIDQLQLCAPIVITTDAYTMHVAPRWCLLTTHSGSPLALIRRELDDSIYSS
jgi:hypothetical protein